MRARTLRCVWGIVLAAASTVVASSAAQGTQPIAPPLAARTATSTGAEMFKAYCAACHGPLGKGDGPAAAALRVKPPDLTGLTRSHGGTFPQKDMEWVLRFGAPLAAHGSSEMPVWGETFRVIGDEASVRYRIAMLVAHLESIQQK